MRGYCLIEFQSQTNMQEDDWWFPENHFLAVPLFFGRIFKIGNLPRSVARRSYLGVIPRSFDTRGAQWLQESGGTGNSAGGFKMLLEEWTLRVCLVWKARAYLYQLCYRAYTIWGKRAFQNEIWLEQGSLRTSFSVLNRKGKDDNQWSQVKKQKPRGRIIGSKGQRSTLCKALYTWMAQ